MSKKSLLVAALTVSSVLCSSCCAVFGINCPPPEPEEAPRYIQELYAPEEMGLTFEKITEESVESLVHPGLSFDTYNRPDWWHYPLIAVTKDGKSVAYIVNKNDKRNVFIRPVGSHGASTTQGTFRSFVRNLCFSPNSESLCFTERASNGTNILYITSVRGGNSVRPVSIGNVYDYAPCYTPDGKKIFFCRAEGTGFSVWSYDIASNGFSNHGYGENPVPINNDEYLCVRKNSTGYYEIWKINHKIGTETILVTEDGRSFASPAISPDGKWILCVSTTKPGLNIDGQENLDIFVVPSDGSTRPSQLTFHQGHDCSPVWSSDGKYIYFLSQRATRYGAYNVWRMNFKAQEASINEYNGGSNSSNDQQDQGGIKLPKRRQR